jgi:isoquinoline 1-oxidoreductase alpha subunit
MATLVVNGAERSFDGDEDMPLLWYLRDEVGLTGTKFGCGVAQCGACTVHLDGTAVRACVTPMAAALGATVTTIEGLSPDGNHPVQVAWRDLNVSQCGYCQPGQIMAAVAKVRQARAAGHEIDDSDLDEIRNICRCGTYNRIREAIKAGAVNM